MNNIIFISTVHEEIGKCNAEELYRIIIKLSPEVIFLEANEGTYSEYEKFLFLTYGQKHNKLEISAIQKYSCKTSFEYVPVCENGLSESLSRKNRIVGGNKERQKLVDNFKSLTAKRGFEFLNSLESINLLEEIWVLEGRVLGSNELKKLEADIEAYERPMIKNIYSYFKDNDFTSAIFMCGAAHRKSIIEKIEKYKTEEQAKLTWSLFGI